MKPRFVIQVKVSVIVGEETEQGVEANDTLNVSGSLDIASRGCHAARNLVAASVARLLDHAVDEYEYGKQAAA